MPIFHAKGKSLSSSLNIPGRQALFGISLVCLLLGRTWTKKSLHIGAEREPFWHSDQQDAGSFCHRKGRRNDAWQSAAQAWIPGRLRWAWRLQMSHQVIHATLPPVHEVQDYSARPCRARVKSEGFGVSQTWLWALMLLLTSWATVDRLQSFNPHFHRTEMISALICQSYDGSLR